MTPRISGITGVVLAGGKSSRFGSNKAFATFKGIPLINRSIQVLNSLFDEVLLVTNTPETYLSLPVKIMVDEKPDQGPLMGIMTALRRAKHEEVFVVGCDMPLVSPHLVTEIIQAERGADVIIPINKETGQKEYLMGLYSKNLIPSLEQVLSEKKLSIKDFCRNLKSIKCVPIEGDSTFNVNQAKDLKDLEHKHA